jgi:hypothetical protein
MVVLILRQFSGICVLLLAADRRHDYTARMFHPRRFLTLLLALSLAVAPLLSSAQGHMGGDATMTADVHARHMVDMTDQDETGGDVARCVSHEGCASQCCVGCGHCATTMNFSPFQSSPNHPVQTPVLLTLHLSQLPAVQSRPPQG